MGKSRIEAFSDGVLAIIITIMVLELRVPHDTTLVSLGSLWPVFASYVMSFIYLGIYWSNHHHMFHAVKHVSGGALWANLHLLFWLSLVPFVTAWMGENHFAAVPIATYGAVMFMAGVAYWILQQTLIAHDGNASLLAVAVGTDFKGKLSPALYLAAIPLAFVSRWLSAALFVTVALIWLVPDRRIERVVERQS